MLRKFREWFENEPPANLAFPAQQVQHEGEVYTLRRMTNDDINAALAIEQAVYNSMPWDRVAFLSELRKRQHSLYLVLTTADETVLAFIGAWFSPAEAHVTNIAVDPKAQRRGIGRFLMKVMLAKAVDFGSPKLTLEVRTDNAVAQHLYHSLGFHDGRIKKGYYVADHGDAMDMWLDLD